MIPPLHHGRHPRRAQAPGPLATIATLLAALTLSAAALHLTLAALTGAQTCRMEHLPQCPKEHNQ